jgi:hypothetical protein
MRLRAAAAAFVLGGIFAGSAGLANAAPSTGRPLDEGVYYVTNSFGCSNCVFNLGANHQMTTVGGTGTWKYVGITHTLTITFVGTTVVYTGTGTPERGFSGAITNGATQIGTFTAAEPAGV